MKFLVFFIVITVALGQQRSVPTLDGRIIGGSSADIADYPYQISLQFFSSHICGGSIISDTWILTAAHCVEDALIPSFLSVRAGSSYRNTGGQVYSVIRTISHPSYVSTTFDYDIALLEISSSITATNAQVIPLPSPGNGPEVNSTAVITGWGTTSEGGTAATVLQVVEVPIISQEDCRSAYSTSLVTDRMICAGVLGVGGKDACQGDSGGPLVVNGTLMGIVSWGYGCARPEYPGVYSNVANLRAWITANSGV